MGEPDGFQEFVVTRSAALTRTARMLTGDHSSAQDLVQAALVKSWRRWETISLGAEEAYVRRVMISIFLKWRLRRWTGEKPVERVPDTALSGDVFAEADTRAVVADALGTLTARQRAVIVLRFVNDLSEADTAQAMHCSVGTVKSQTSRALANLRQSPLRYLFTEEESANGHT